jgi:membrane protein YdbS with pleckstrin-like domain
MDDTDVNRGGEGPFDGETKPAVRRVEDDAGSAAGGDAVSTVGDDAGPDVPDVEDLVGPRRTLEPSIQVIWALRSAVTAVILGVVAGVAASFLPVVEPWIGAAVFFVMLVVGVGFSVLRYRSWAYEVREDSLYLERGVVTRVRTVVPYVRIQHVDASRGPLERVFGLATTVVYTAGSRGADVSIPGLTPGRSTDLQTRLKQLAIASEGEDAV